MIKTTITTVLLTIAFIFINTESKSQVSIANVECIYTLCDVKANVILANTGTGLTKLEYRLQNNGLWSAYQASSSFTVNKGKSYRVQVRDIGNNTTSEFDFSVENKNISVSLEGDITHIDCDNNKGDIDISLIGGYRYITTTNNDNIVFAQPVLTPAVKDFTLEILVRLDDTSAQLDTRGTVGLIGQDNTLEFGFRQGAPSFYLYTDRGAVDHQTSAKKIDDDHQWHQLVVRGDGGKVEMLVDGNIWFSYLFSVAYTSLRSDTGTNFNPISIGQKVWGDVGGRGFNGDIGRATFWKRYLSKDELSQLRQGTLPIETDDDCLAAYTLHNRVNGKLPSLKGEDGVFSSSRIIWSDTYTCTWTYPDGTSSTAEDLINADAGVYRLHVEYDPRDCSIVPLDKTFEIEDKKSLKATITGIDEKCQGDTFTLNAEAINGSSTASPQYTYQWQKYTSSWQNIAGANSSSLTSKSSSLGENKFRVIVNSNFCNDISTEKIIYIREAISTQEISR